MDKAKLQRQDKIRRWMLVMLAIVFVTAIALLKFAPSLDTERSKIRLTKEVKTEVAVVDDSQIVQVSPANVQDDVQKDYPLEESGDPVTDSLDNNVQQIIEVNPVQNLSTKTESIPAPESDFQSTESQETGQVNSINNTIRPKLKNVTRAEVRHSNADDKSTPPEIAGDKELSGQVQDIRGDPVAAVTIQLGPQSPGKDAPNQRTVRQTETNSEGRFSFQYLPDGDYRLILSADGFGKVSHIARADTTDIILVLPDKLIVTVQGNVVDRNGQPLSDVSVSIDGEFESKTNLDGRYQINNTFEFDSNYRLVFTLDGFREVNDIIKISANPMTIDKQLQPAGQLQLKGQVMDEYGTSLSGATVWLYSRAAEIERRVTSDDDGYFTLEDLKRGTDYQLTVSMAGHKKFSDNMININQSSQPLRIELKALSTGSISGVIVDSSGLPVPNYAVRIVNSNDTSSTKIVTSDSAGQFKAINLREGALQVSSLSEPRTRVSGINLQAGQDLYTTLIVDFGDYEIVGKVIDGDGRILPNAQIHLTWSHAYDKLRSNSTRRLQTDAEGYFHIQNVGAGSHLLTVSAQGLKNASMEVNTGQQSGPLTIELMH